jgi:lysophospholipase L1-like esterase
VVCFAIGEFGLRVLGYHGGVSFKIEDTILVDDPILNWRNRPSSEFYAGNIAYRFNEKGFRDHSYNHKKPENTFRVFLASDSIGFGTNVRLEDAYPKLLESQANALHESVRTEVISYSMPGLSLRQKFHLVEQYAHDYHPDLIIIDYAINDVEFESKKTSIAGEKSRCSIELLHLPFPCAWKERLKESAFLFALQQGIESVLHRMNWEDQNHFYRQVEGDYYHSLYAMSAKQEYLDLWFRKIGEYQKETGVPILVPIFPLIYDYAQYKWEDLNQLIVQQCEMNGLAHISLLSAYRTNPWNELRVQRGDFTHPSIKGNTIAAQAILGSLQMRNMLGQRSIPLPLQAAH